uniref:H15 domain-containing protein n=1 Tax=Labrus bergylta TaxID=56723 RepID=A0A3Q3G2L1_9LABR
MAEVAPAPAKEAKKKAPKPKKTGPSVGELIVKYVSASKERSGVSVAAIKKLLANGGYDVEKNNSRVKVAIKSLVAKEILIQVKGIGASGSQSEEARACDMDPGEHGLLVRGLQDGKEREKISVIH